MTNRFGFHALIGAGLVLALPALAQQIPAPVITLSNTADVPAPRQGDAPLVAAGSGVAPAPAGPSMRLDNDMGPANASPAAAAAAAMPAPKPPVLHPAAALAAAPEAAPARPAPSASKAVPAAPAPQPAALAAAPAGSKPVPVASQPAAATPAAAPAAVATVAGDDPSFPHLAILQPQVDFWTKVFAEYSENQSVVHSMDDVRKVWVVLDFTDQAQTLNAVQLSLLKSRIETQTKQHLDDLLKQVDALKDSPEKMDDEQRRMYQLYTDSRDPQRFRDAIGTFRVQRGLRERTANALQVSGRYLPQMEQIFASYGLPVRLTRLPLVESSFNLQAYSKVGAAGLWQFMPASARIYMRLDEVTDDRRDPWFSTDAAARHLRDDYQALQNWPLAVTAYNFGRGGVVRALEQINGTGLDDMLRRYDGDRFGFASRNFYAEFLAASDVEHNWHKYFGDVQRDEPTRFETVETRDYVPYATLRRLSGADDVTFHTLNPAYNDEVTDGRLYVPPGHLIRVPAGAADRFKLAYASLGGDQRFEHQRQFYVMHRLERGESVARLAHRFGVSQQAILAANGLSPKTRLRAGSMLKIPPHDAPSSVVASADVPEAHVLKASVHGHAAHGASSRTRLHKVRSGQTLGSIAKRYQTSVTALRQLNGLGEADLLRVGSTLKVPSH